MNRLTLKSSMVVAALLFFATQIYAEPIWEKYPDYISTALSRDGIKNNHPKVIPVDKIARILSQVKVKNSPYTPDKTLWENETKAIRLFTDREIDLLGKKFSQAIAELPTDKKIIFSISDYRVSFLGKKRLHISGSIFIRNNHLNLILGEVHIDLSTLKTRSGVTGNYGRTKNTLNTGDTVNPGQKEWEIITFEGASLAQGRKDWLTINLENKFSFATSNEGIKSNSDKYLTSEQKKISNETLDSRISKLESLSSPQQTSTNIENRLRHLQKIYNNGALPEALYLEKVRLILNEL